MLTPIEVGHGEVKDQVQVRELARGVPVRDRNSELRQLCERPADLTTAQRETAKNEVCWILNWELH